MTAPTIAPTIAPNIVLTHSQARDILGKIYTSAPMLPSVLQAFTGRTPTPEELSGIAAKLNEVGAIVAASATTKQVVTLTIEIGPDC
jgi:hypothetical protein